MSKNIEKFFIVGLSYSCYKPNNIFSPISNTKEVISKFHTSSFNNYIPKICFKIVIT